MTPPLCSSFGAVLCAAYAQSPAAPHQKEDTAGQVQSALEGAYGVHPGDRRNHAKGTCALGVFSGAADTARYTRSALFSGSPVKVVARFSLAGGDPNARDTEKSVRGMALEFRLPNGSLQHMTMINTPVFFAAMPRTFLDKMLALKPDPATGKPDPAVYKAFLATHPDAVAQTQFLAANNPPPSYANAAYSGIHTFKFINAANKVTLVRWRFVPRDGEKELSNAELASLPANFLEAELIARTHKGPAIWDMFVTIGEPGDVEDDPTILWPKGRKEVAAGTLMITSAMKQEGAGCADINYDPLVLSDGIEATRDPVLLFRSPSYAASFTKQLQGK